MDWKAAPLSTWIFLPYNPGDVVMGLQVAGWLQSQSPEMALDFWVAEEAQDLTADLGLRDVIRLPRQALKRAWQDGDLRPAWALLESLLKPCQKRQYDLGVNLFQEKLGGYVAGLLPGKKRVGLYYGTEAGSRFFTRALEHLYSLPVQRRLNPFHAIDLYQRAIVEAWNNPGLCLPTSHTTHPLQRRFEGLAHKNTSTPDLKTTRAVFHLGSAWIGKRYPITNWIHLTELLMEAGWTIFLSGSKEDLPLGEALIQGLRKDFKPKVISLIGTASLSETAEKISQVDWVITGDTVAMHLAAAVGTRVLALFGPSQPLETGPYGKGHFIFETQLADYPESLAFNTPHQGLNELPAEEIAAFLLRAKYPTKARLWETDWWEEGQCQVLRDSKGEIRNQPLIAAWNQIFRFQKNALVPATTTLIEKPDLALAWEKAWQAASETPNPETVARLNEAEYQWGETTRRELVWEAYRISINAQHFDTLAESLAFRRKRWDLTWQESQILGETMQSVLAALGEKRNN